MFRLEASQVKYGLLVLLVHAILIKSIFDVYFTSPLVQGAPPVSLSLPHPAQRLVLFIADGLRADLFFSRDPNHKVYSPYLHEIIRTRGSWGVSHTRVPTETRPGHVALIAGFYEDVSAVTRGWQDNPVEFDSLFNRSRHTYSWGSADVLWMFAKGTSLNKVNVSTTGDLDFGLEDSSVLDEWVFAEVDHMFERAQKNSTFESELREDKLVFFLHLIGLDTNGHSHRPTSRQYLNNIAIVDQGVERMVERFESFFGDSSTAYVYTSDHGMTDWGSHGAGNPHETLTPLVCWGAGVRSPLSPLENLYSTFDRDRVPLDGRMDVEQADINPLMSVLLGLPFPVNSVGKIPLSYLNMSDRFKADAIKSNAISILGQMQIKEESVKESSFSTFYSPYEPLTPSKQVDYVRRISAAVNKLQFQSAISLSEELIGLSKDGMKYYHHYNKLFLYFLISSSFIFWIIFNAFLLLKYSMGDTSHSSINFRALLAASCLSSLILFLKSSQLSHYLYSLLTSLLFSLLFFQFSILRRIHFRMQIYSFQSVPIYLILIWVMVAGFHYREVFSVGLILLSFWPYLYTDLFTSYNMRPVVLLWTLVCWMCSLFPLLPVTEKVTSYPIVIITGTVVLTLCSIFAYMSSYVNKNLILFQLTLLAVSILNIVTVSISLASGQGTYLVSRIISWTVLLVSIPTPMLVSRDINTNFFHCWLSLYCPYLLLSTSHEIIFSLLFPTLLYLWALIESIIDSPASTQCTSYSLSYYVSNIPQERNEFISNRYVRRTLFIIFFGLLGFFGTGNIASVNTFDIASVYAFITLFSPFTMGLLLIVKIGIPLLWVGNACNLVLNTTHSRRHLIILLILIICDFMALHFFFMITDEGSWLEIGTSISHYVIAMGMILGIMLITALSSLYISVNIDEYIDVRIKQH